MPLTWVLGQHFDALVDQGDGLRGRLCVRSPSQLPGAPVGILVRNPRQDRG